MEAPEMESVEQERTTQAMAALVISESDVDGDCAMTEAEAEARSEEEGRSTMANKLAATGTRKKKLIKFHKEFIEFILRCGPPRPFPSVLRPCPVQLELTEYAQKRIDRYEQIHDQYEHKGYAEIEFTDDEDTAEIDDAELEPAIAWKVDPEVFAVFIERMMAA